MSYQSAPIDESVALFVKDILVFDESEITTTVKLPFYADGCPGLLYYESEQGLTVNPHNKQMPQLFLYGQTIQPIELVLQGPYKIIVFQLYPFVLRSFFNINPIEINDGCHDLTGLEKELSAIRQQQSISDQIDSITGLLYGIFEQKKQAIDPQVKEAISIIETHNGQLPITSLYEKLNITQRTFERRFLKETGLTPKQFSKIIQFQLSFDQLANKDFNTLSDVVYRNGYADQSHFIRVFKAFTNKTPKYFQSKA